MSGYTIAAIPTVYRGRTYRSRLEAKWGAFFDRIGWRHEYEPFDLGAWSPDFLLPDLDTLVEVKPWTEFNEETADRIVEACGDKQLLLTMAAPELVTGGSSKNEPVGVTLGWFLPVNEETWQHATLFWLLAIDQPRLDADIVWPPYVDGRRLRHEGQPVWLSAGGNKGYSEGPGRMMHPYPSHTMKLWADACNAVQWEPDR
jgi:hypothetical protein